MYSDLMRRDAQEAAEERFQHDPDDWMELCNPDPTPLTPEQFKRIWTNIMLDIAAKRDAKAGLS